MRKIGSVPIFQVVSCLDGYDPDALHVAKAREAIRACITPLTQVETVPVRAALGRVLAQDIVPKINVPSHRVERAWSPVPGGSLGGGIWAWGGVSVDHTRHLFTGTGNVVSRSEHDFYAEQPVRGNIIVVVFRFFPFRPFGEPQGAALSIQDTVKG